MKRITLLLVSVLIAGGLSARTPEGQVDGYGYRLATNAGGLCGFAWVAPTGSPLAFAAPYARPGDPPATDDGGAVVPLAAPFEFYGSPFGAIVVSPNGYLAFAGSLEEEDGRDFSNDPVGSVPTYYLASGSPRFSSPARALVFHDDLQVGGGQVTAQYHPTCPRVSEALGVEPCTVVSWAGVQIAGSGAPLSFQVVLYHQSFQLAFQYQVADSTGGGSATVGIQSPNAEYGLEYAFDQPGAVFPGSSVCFFEPRFPPGGPSADLALTLQPGETPPDVGPFSLPLHVGNQGPSPAQNVVATLFLPTGIAYSGDSCGNDFADGQWQVGVLPPRGGATCTLNLLNNGGGVITAAVTSSAADPDPANNQDSWEVQAADDGDGVAPEIEDSYPGGDGFPRFGKGDGNGDGIPDRLQPQVATLPLAIGKGWVTVEVSGCPHLQEVITLLEAAAGPADPLFDYPLGLVGFNLPCPRAEIKLWVHLEATPPSRYRARSFLGWQDVPATLFRERFVWGYSLDLADGSAGDMTGKDGVIRHRGGGAQAVTSPGKRP